MTLNRFDFRQIKIQNELTENCPLSAPQIESTVAFDHTLVLPAVAFCVTHIPKTLSNWAIDVEKPAAQQMHCN
jgi:hypothetical protein